MKKILIILVVGLVCTNARSLKKPKKIKVIQLPSCGCPKPFIDTLPCNCQKLSIDDSNILKCSCQETYGVLNAELPNYGRISAINMPVARCDCNRPIKRCDALPAINLPDFSCSCQSPMTYQCVENTCGCRKPGFVEYLSVETVMPAVIDTFAPSQIASVPTCGCGCQSSCGCQKMPCNCQTMPCSCQNVPCYCQNVPCNCPKVLCTCQNMPCNCPTLPCTCLEIPCSCQSMSCSCPKIPCSCQSIPCIPTMTCNCQTVPCNYPSVSCNCQNMPCVCQNIPCGCQTIPCSCQNMPCTCQSCMPTLDLPCGCQSSQMSPVYSYQSLPPPVIGCGGKYLRQITIQPPFL